MAVTWKKLAYDEDIDAKILTHKNLASAHHAQSHTLASHSTKAHSELTGVTTSQHHTKTTSGEIDHGSVLGLADDDHTGHSIIKAWIRFNGAGTISIVDSYNVSSIADNGTGKYTVYWDTDFANAGYAVIASVVKYDNTADPANKAVIGKADLHPSVGSCPVYTGPGSNFKDTNCICLIAIGDQ